MAKFVLYKDVARQFRWRFKSANGQIIADSGEGYVLKSGALAGISFVKKYSPDADVEDKTAPTSHEFSEALKRILGR